MTDAEVIVGVWCLSIGLTDLYSRRIPNILTLGPCLIGMCYLLINGHALLGSNWKSVLIGILISLIFTLPAFALRMLGAADAKLLLAIALIGGWYLTLLAFVIASFLTVLYIFADYLINRLDIHHSKPSKWIPFGAALGAGLLCAIGILL